MDNEHNHVHSVPRRMQANWARPDEVQKIIILSSLMGAFVTNIFFGKFLAGAVLIVGVALYAPAYGKRKLPGYRKIVEVVQGYLLRRSGGAIYTVDMKNTALSFDKNTGALVPSKMKKHRFSTKIIAIPLGDSILTFFRERVGSEDFLIGALIGEGHPRAMTGSAAQRFMWDHLYTDGIKTGLNTTNERVDYGQVVICRKMDVTEVEAYAEERWHPDFTDPAPGSPEARMKAEELEHLDITYADAKQYRLCLFVRMSFPKAWKRKDLGALTPDQVRAAPIMKVLEAWKASLKAGVTELRYPSYFEMNEIGHLVFNSEGLDLFYSEQREDLKKEANGELKSLEDATTLRRGPWPSSVVAAHNHLIANETMHSTLVVTGLDSDELPVGFLDDLHTQADFPYIFSRTVQTLPYSKGMKRSRRKARFVGAARGFKNRGRSDDFDLEGQERENEAMLGYHGLFRSKSRSTQARIHLTVSGPVNLEALTLNRDLASSMLRSHGMINEPYVWAPNQLPPILSHLCIFGEE
jgi:hypothetical protein